MNILKIPLPYYLRHIYFFFPCSSSTSLLQVAAASNNNLVFFANEVSCKSNVNFGRDFLQPINFQGVFSYFLHI